MKLGQIDLIIEAAKASGFAIFEQLSLAVEE